jgi:hypothetical protein
MKWFVALMIVCLSALPGFTQSVFIWDADDGDQLTDPLGEGTIGTQYALYRALGALGFSPMTSTVLPATLSGYDMIFVATGWYDC